MDPIRPTADHVAAKTLDQFVRSQTKEKKKIGYRGRETVCRKTNLSSQAGFVCLGGTRKPRKETALHCSEDKMVIGGLHSTEVAVLPLTQRARFDSLHSRKFILRFIIWR